MIKRLSTALLLLSLPRFVVAQPPSDQGASPSFWLNRTAERYKGLAEYTIQSRVQFAVMQQGQTGAGENKIALMVGKDGMFRVMQDDGKAVEMRVSDGKTTWKAFTGEKVWAKQEVAQAFSSDDDDAEPTPSARKDLFMRTQSSFVTRYTGLERYAKVAQMEKSEKLKQNGSKVECVAIHIALPGSDNRIFIARDSGFVVRHIESLDSGKQHSQITTDYTRIEPGQPSPDNFDFVASRGSKEVSDFVLPSERNMSWVGQPAADFTFKNLEGASVRLAELQGKIVLLDFWATWCPPCRRELPTIAALSRQYTDQGVVVLGVNDEDAKTARNFLEAHHPDLATLHDAGGKIHRLYGAYSIPTVLVIDRKGTVVAHFVGERQKSDLVTALKRAGME